MFRSTFEQKDGTFWVASVSDLDVFDRRTGKVVEHYSLRNPFLSRTANSSGCPAGCFNSGRPGRGRTGGPISWFFCTRSRRRKDTQAGASAIHEDTHGGLWVGTNGDGLLRLGPDRMSFVQYRHNPNDLDSLSVNQVVSDVSDSVGSIGADMGDQRNIS
jgi:ligand-binding sensor domain-containing protein